MSQEDLVTYLIQKQDLRSKVLAVLKDLADDEDERHYDSFTAYAKVRVVLLTALYAVESISAEQLAHAYSQARSAVAKETLSDLEGM